MSQLGKKIIIIDIENPNLTFRAWIWNRYYKYFLNDQGQYFLDRKKMKSLLGACFPKEQITINVISTIKGNYLMAIINQ